MPKVANVVVRSSWWCTTIGRKQLVGLTGLGLSLFVLIHMLENMLIFAGAQPYNEYAHMLTSNPFIYVAEAGLLAIFAVHLLIALALSWLGVKARHSRYAMKPSGAKSTGLTQRSLWAQGLLILLFVILHLNTFKYGPAYVANYGHGEVRDLHRLIIEVFQQSGYLLWYLVALVILGLHLSHGMGSSLQTFGIYHPRYQKMFKCLSWSYAVVVACGFMSQPIYVYFFYRG